MLTFEPVELGSVTGVILAVSSQAGCYNFPVLGVAETPSPQGPIIITTARPETVTLRNVFLQTTEFQLKVCGLESLDWSSLF